MWVVFAERTSRATKVEGWGSGSRFKSRSRLAVRFFWEARKRGNEDAAGERFADGGGLTDALLLPRARERTRAGSRSRAGAHQQAEADNFGGRSRGSQRAESASVYRTEWNFGEWGITLVLVAARRRTMDQISVHHERNDRNKKRKVNVCGENLSREKRSLRTWSYDCGKSCGGGPSWERTRAMEGMERENCIILQERLRIYLHTWNVTRTAYVVCD